jgi:hypothetical protein
MIHPLTANRPPPQQAKANAAALTKHFIMGHPFVNETRETENHISSFQLSCTRRHHAVTLFVAAERRRHPANGIDSPPFIGRVFNTSTELTRFDSERTADYLMLNKGCYSAIDSIKQQTVLRLQSRQHPSVVPSPAGRLACPRPASGPQVPDS